MLRLWINERYTIKILCEFGFGGAILFASLRKQRIVTVAGSTLSNTHKQKCFVYQLYYTTKNMDSAWSFCASHSFFFIHLVVSSLLCAAPIHLNTLLFGLARGSSETDDVNMVFLI